MRRAWAAAAEEAMLLPGRSGQQEAVHPEPAGHHDSRWSVLHRVGTSRCYP